MRTDLDNAQIGTCENCHKEGVWIRRQEVTEGAFGSGPRGFFKICIDCCGPVQYCIGPLGEMETPLYWPKEKVQEYLNKSMEAKI